MVRWYVRPAGPRPDFRLVLAFLWGDDATDTDGDSDHPASRAWTELYARNRTRPDEAFQVSPASAEPLVLLVESDRDGIAAAVAYVLAESTGGVVSEAPDGRFGPPATVLGRICGFDLPAAWERFRDSPYQRATLEDPYPGR